MVCAVSSPLMFFTCNSLQKCTLLGFFPFGAPASVIARDNVIIKNKHSLKIFYSFILKLHHRLDHMLLKRCHNKRVKKVKNISKKALKNTQFKMPKIRYAHVTSSSTCYTNKDLNFVNINEFVRIVPQ